MERVRMTFASIMLTLDLWQARQTKPWARLGSPRHTVSRGRARQRHTNASCSRDASTSLCLANPKMLRSDTCSRKPCRRAPLFRGRTPLRRSRGHGSRGHAQPRAANLDVGTPKGSRRGQSCGAARRGGTVTGSFPAPRIVEARARTAGPSFPADCGFDQSSPTRPHEDGSRSTKK